MSLISIPCPRCADPGLALLTDQGHCECARCGARFTVAWPPGGAPQLTPFAALLRESPSEAAYLAADRRLALIGRDLDLAHEEVDLRHTELREITARLKALGVTYQETAERLGVRYRIALAVALVAWIQVLLVLEHLWWYGGLALAAGATFAALRLYEARKRARREAEARVEAEHPEIPKAKQQLREALAHQNDLQLEQKLCAMIVRRYRNTDEDDAPIDAAPARRGASRNRW